MFFDGPVCMCIEYRYDKELLDIIRRVHAAVLALDTHTVFVVWLLVAAVVVVMFGVMSALLVPHVHTYRRGFRK